MTSFVQQNAAAAMQIEKETGIPHQLLLAIPGNETGWGSAMAGNNYFGIKGSNPNTGANTGSVGTWEVINGQRVNINDTFRAYSGYEESARDFANFLQTNSRYAPALDYLKKQPNDWRGFVRMVHDAGYATDPQWSNKIISIGNDIDGVDVSGNGTPLGSTSATKGTQSVVTNGVNQVGTRPLMKSSMSTSQFGDPQLSEAEAYSACGPAAAVRFAQAYGRNPTLREATDLAKGVGWSAANGMAGIGSEQKLLSQMGVDTQMISGAQWDQFAQLASTGAPITISTPGHYFYADDYNPKDNTFHVGKSGTDLKHGSEWMTPGQMEGLMGRAQGALYSTNPIVDQGGVTTSDCAPSVAWMYQAATGLRVPGDMKMMYGSTQSVKAGNAAPGDLVFYGMNGSEDDMHAGVYLGNGLMVHDNSANPNGGVDVIPIWDGAEFRRVPGVDPMLASYSNSGKAAQPQAQPQETLGDWMITSHGGRQMMTAVLSSGRMISQDMGGTDAPTGTLLSSSSGLGSAYANTVPAQSMGTGNEADDDGDEEDDTDYSYLDTPLSPQGEAAFQIWKAKNAPRDSGFDYDLRGAFSAGVTPDPETGHWPDTYKKPNHPTFSDQSKWAKDYPDKAGHWDGDTYLKPSFLNPSTGNYDPLKSSMGAGADGDDDQQMFLNPATGNYEPVRRVIPGLAVDQTQTTPQETVQAAGQAVGSAASDVGTAAHDVASTVSSGAEDASTKFQQSAEAGTLGSDLASGAGDLAGSAGSAVGGIFSGLGSKARDVADAAGGAAAATPQKAQDIGQAAQDLNAQTPGTEAVKAVQEHAPEVAKNVSDIDTAIRNVSDTVSSAPVEATKAVGAAGAQVGAKLATPEGRDELGTAARDAADYVASPEGQEKIDTANRIIGVANPQTAAQTLAPGVQASTSYLIANGIDVSGIQKQFQQDITPEPGSLIEQVDEGHRLGVGEIPQFTWEVANKAMDTLYNTRVQAVRAVQAPEIRDTPEGGALQHALAIASDPTMYLGMGGEVAKGAKAIDDAAEVANSAAAREGAATAKGALGRFLGEELGAAGTPGDVEAARAAQQGSAESARAAAEAEPGVAARAKSQSIMDEAARNPMSPDSPVAVALDRPYAKDEEAHLLQNAALDLNDSDLLDASHKLDGVAKHEPLNGEQLRRVVLNAVAKAHPEYEADEVLAHTDRILIDSGQGLLSHSAQIAAGRDIPDAVFFARRPWWASPSADAAATAANQAARTGDMSGLPNLAQVAADGAGKIHDAAAAAVEAGVTRTPNVLKRVALSAATGAAAGGSELAYGDPDDPNRYAKVVLKASGGALLGALAPYAGAFIDKSVTSRALDWGKDVLAPAEQLSKNARAPFTDWANGQRLARDAGARLEDQWRSVFGNGADGELAAYIERTGQLPDQWAKVPGAQEALDKWKSVADWARKYEIVPDPLNLTDSSRVQTYIPHVLDKDWDIALKDVAATDMKGPGRFNANPFRSYNKSREFETLQDGIDAGTQYAQDLPKILGSYYQRAIQQANNQSLISRWSALAEKNRIDQYPLAEIANKLLAGEDVVKAAGKNVPMGYKHISDIPGFEHIKDLEDTVISPDLYNVMHNATNPESGLQVLRPLQDLSSIFKHNTLQGSAFHALNEVRQIFATHGAAAPATLFKILTQTTTEGGYRSFMDASRPIVDQAIKDGLTINVVPDRLDNLNAAQRWGLAVANMAGGSVAGYQTALNAGEDNNDALKQAALFGAVGGVLGAPVFKLSGLSDESRSLIEHFSHAMWDRWIPSAKLMTYQMYAPQYGGQAAASFTNSVFGGQNLLAIARSRTVQDALSLGLLAPDWQEGWARLAGNALFSWGKDAPLGDMARNYWSNALVQHAVTLEGMNLALGGHFSWQNDPDATLMVDATRFYDMMNWDHTDQKTGQSYTPYWDILGPYRGMMEPMQEAARAATAAAYQASGYDLSKLPLHDEVMGKWGSIPPSDPGDAIKSFLGSRSGLIPSTFGEIVAQRDFANRPIDQADDSDAQRALNRVWQITSHMVPTYLSESARDNARGDPAPIALWSAATGMRTRREDETTKFFDWQDQFVKQNQMDAQQWADIRAKSRAHSDSIDAQIQKLEAGQVKNPDGSDMTAAQRTNQIADLGDQRPTQRKDLQALIDDRHLPDGPEKDRLQGELNYLLSQDITSGSPTQPADLTPEQAPNADELYRLAWNRDPGEVDRYKGTAPQPEGLGGVLDSVRRAIQNPPGGSDDKALQALRSRWVQETAQTWGIDPAALQDLVKSKAYQENLPPLPNVTSGQLDDITDGYRKAGLQDDGRPIPDAAMAASSKQQYLMDTAGQLGLDPQALYQRVKLRTLPMGDPTPESVSRSHALDVLSQSRYYKYQNADGTPMGTPQDWKDWDKELSDNKDRFHFTSRGGQGFFFKDGQPDEKLNNLYAAQQQGQANRYKAVYTSPNRDDYYRWFGDGANLTDKQWQQYSNGTLDMWHDTPSQKEALNRVQAMRLWASLTPQQQNTYANGDGRAPIKWEAPSVGGQGTEVRGTSLAAYMAYIRTYRNKDYDLGDIDQKQPEAVSSAGG